MILRSAPYPTLVCTALLSLAACEQNVGEQDAQLDDIGARAVSCGPAPDRPVRIEGGTFEMGQSAVYAEEVDISHDAGNGSCWM